MSYQLVCETNDPVGREPNNAGGKGSEDLQTRLALAGWIRLKDIKNAGTLTV